MSTSKEVSKLDKNMEAEGAREDSESGDGEEEYKCGYLSWKPRWLQRCANPRALLACVCWFTFTQGFVVNGIIYVNLSQWERLYELSSQQSAWIVSVYDISAAFFTLLFGYIGRFTHNGSILSIGAGVMATGSLLMVMPQVLSDPYELGPLAVQICDLSGNSTGEVCEEQEGSNYYWFLLVGQLFHGVGGAAVYTLAIPYMDDQIQIKNTPLYIGIMQGFAALGPAMGYICGGLILQVYVDVAKTDAEVELEPSDPRWVGAWWIGLVYSGLAPLTVSALMACFPRELPSARLYKAERVSQAYKGSDARDETSAGQEVVLSDIGPMLKNIFTNPVWLCLTVSSIIESGAITGFAAFLPKMIQFQFSKSATEAAVYAGLVVVPGAAGGQVLGGLIPRWLNLRLRGLLLQAFINTFICLLLSFQFLLRCSEPAIAGVTVPYFNSSYELAESDVYHPCNEACNCSTASYDPVCGTDAVQYFNPCYAGCTQVVEQDDTLYYNCSCIPQTSTDVNKLQSSDFAQFQHSMAYRSDKIRLFKEANTEQPYATEGVCEEDCDIFYLFLVLFLAMNLCTFITATAAQAATIRAVPDSHRSFAYGVQLTFDRLLGNVPGPIIFGLVFDAACVVWQVSCGEQGSCWIYDTQFVAEGIFWACVVVKGVSSLGFLFAFLLYKPPAIEPMLEKEVNVDDCAAEDDKSSGDKSSGDMSSGDKYSGDKSSGVKSSSDKHSGDYKAFNNDTDSNTYL